MSPIIRHEIRSAGLILTLAILIAGCGKSPEPAVDTVPFEQAVEQYLAAHNMALAIKDIKEGPTVEGTKATMIVSLTHSELGGASVTWDFQFEKDPDGTWKAVSHRD
ncbi:MAG: hypothetical protein GXX96_03860 [Planctomycetaceae bacterium]|jgi:hypothetical protein|nr:hypothetical protein [Planctomycetaceae bacterium]